MAILFLERREEVLPALLLVGVRLGGVHLLDALDLRNKLRNVHGNQLEIFRRK
jgi:hypothetical protein